MRNNVKLGDIKDSQSTYRSKCGRFIDLKIFFHEQGARSNASYITCTIVQVGDRRSYALEANNKGDFIIITHMFIMFYIML